MSTAQAPRRTTVLASLGAAAALAASLLGTAAPAQAAPAAAAPRAVVRPTAVAPTVLTSAMDRCLRQATADPGGAVVITDARISATESGRISRKISDMPT